MHDESQKLMHLPLACQHGDHEENSSRWLQLCFSLSLVERSKPKPTTFLPHSQKQHLIVTQNELKRHEWKPKKTAHRSLQKSFSFSTESTLAPKARHFESFCARPESSLLILSTVFIFFILFFFWFPPFKGDFV